MLEHDMRSALVELIGNISKARQDCNDPTVAALLEGAGVSAENLVHLMGEVADLSDTQRPNSEVTLEDIETAPFLDLLRALWRSAAQDKALALSIQCEPSFPAIICTDRIRLLRILRNVVQNALKFTDHGGVTVKFGLVDDRLTIDVEDTGPGFSDAAMSCLYNFEGRPLNAIKDGSGLGLHITKALVEDLDGSIHIENRPQGGARVHLEMRLWPQNSEAEHPRQPEMAVLPSAKLPDLSGLRILLAEDNLTNQVVVTQMLEAMGADYEVALDGVVALELFDAGRFDLGLIDIEMPRLSGLEFIRRVRGRTDDRAGTPLVAFTAYAMQEHRDRIAAAGADGLIAKPVLGLRNLGNEILSYLPGHKLTRAADPADGENAAGSSQHFVDPQVYDALVASIGPEILGELMEKVREDLLSVRASLGDDADAQMIRGASHVLISVSGTVGAMGLQESAQRLNTATHGNNLALIESARKECLDGIARMLVFVTEQSR